MFFPHSRVKVSIVGSLRDREVACSTSDRQGSSIESCVWRTVSSHHPQEVLLARFSLYVHKGGLKPDSFNFVHLLAAVLKQSPLQLLAFVLNQSPLQLLAAVFMQSQPHVLAAAHMQSGHQLLLLQSKFIEQFTSPCIDSHQMSSDKNNEVQSPTRQRLTKRKPFIDRPGSLFNINSSGISTR